MHVPTLQNRNAVFTRSQDLRSSTLLITTPPPNPTSSLVKINLNLENSKTLPGMPFKFRIEASTNRVWLVTKSNGQLEGERLERRSPFSLEKETSFYDAVWNILVIFFLLFILISYRNPKHAEWAHSYIAALIELQQYCKEFHPIGVSWAAE